ncbi:hypothetical protein ACQPZJ_09750 [Actinoplanes sp. CA-054009]
MSSTLDERKRAELLAKIEALRAELAQWRSAAARNGPLEKHHSQINRLTGRLDVLTELLAADLDATGDLLGEWTGLELGLLDVHHLWDFFRSKLTARYAPWLRDTLVVADELVWSCYAPAQRAAVNAGTADLAGVREPPLTYFATDSTPVAVSRHSVYEQRGRAADLWTTRFAAELRALPVPVTAAPWHQAGHLPDMLLLAHEAGHHVEDDFGLVAELPDALTGFWKPRLGEVFADVYGVLGAGAAYVAALIDFLAAPPATIAAEVAPAHYPTTHLRVQVALAALRATCPADPRATELTDAWWAAHPGHARSDLDADVTPVVEALLGHGRLTGVLSFAPLHAEAEIDVKRLLAGLRPRSSNPRALLAAATLAFRDDPAAYRAKAVAQRTMERVREVQETGTRFRSRAADQPGLADADRVAAEALYARIVRGR